MTAVVHRIGLDRETVVAAVLRLAAKHGVVDVTMRSIAAELGVSAPSLYHHLPSKQSILDLAAEEVLSSIEIGPATGTWEQRLRRQYGNARRQLLTIPGIATVLQTRPLSMAGRAQDQASRQILHDGGFSPAEIDDINSLLYTHLLGSVSLEHNTVAAGIKPASSAGAYEYGLSVILSGLVAQRDAQ